MSEKQKDNKNIGWVLTQMQEISEATESDEIEYDLNEFSKLDGAPPISIQRAVIFQLDDKKVIAIIDGYSDTSKLSNLKPVRGGGYIIEPFGFSLKILRPKFDEVLRNVIGSSRQPLSVPKLIPIENVRLSERNKLLEVNNGEIIIPFSLKSNGEGIEKETKKFKVFVYLWEFRREIESGKIKTKGSFESISDLTIACGCLSDGATYQQIKRLRRVFEKKGLLIKIEGKRNKYQLVIELWRKK